MCGGFVALSGQSPRPLLGQASYHTGRLCTYLVLGAVAGGIGIALNQAGTSAGLTHAASIVTGILLVVNGMVMLFGRSPAVHRIFPLNHFFALHQKLLARRSHGAYFPFALGLFSTLLPCGWLYSYVIVAAGTASPLWAALTMFAFWAGTLPLLITIGSLSTLISSPLKRFVPTLISLLMIGAGILSMGSHLGFFAMNHSGMSESCPMDHPTP